MRNISKTILLFMIVGSLLSIIPLASTSALYIDDDKDPMSINSREVISDPDIKIRASKGRKKQIDELFKDTGWKTLNLKFYKEDSWFFLFDEEQSAYEELSQEIGLSGKGFKTVYRATKKYLTKSKNIYGTVSFLVFYDFNDNISGVLLIPAARSDAPYKYGENNSANMFSVMTKQGDIIAAIKELRKK